MGVDRATKLFDFFAHGKGYTIRERALSGVYRPNYGNDWFVKVVGFLPAVIGCSNPQTENLEER